MLETEIKKLTATLDKLVDVLEKSAEAPAPAAAPQAGRVSGEDCAPAGVAMQQGAQPAQPAAQPAAQVAAPQAQTAAPAQQVAQPPAQTAAPTGEAWTLETVQRHCQEVAQRIGVHANGIGNILNNNFKIESLTQLSPEHYPAFIQAVDQLEAWAAAQPPAQ